MDTFDESWLELYFSEDSLNVIAKEDTRNEEIDFSEVSQPQSDLNVDQRGNTDKPSQ